MTLKPRLESFELKVLRSLNIRMNLKINEQSNYMYLKKGYDGERLFDKWLETLTNAHLILNDLLLEYNGTVFQIDTLLFYSDKIYHFEVKNYEGDFYIEADRWYALTGKEIKNPLLQLKRTESLLRQLLVKKRFNHTIESYLIFVNPKFHLYQAPLNLPIVFPTQLTRFMEKLKNKHSKLKDSHKKLAKELLSIHKDETPYNRLPEYQYDELEKGLICPLCHSMYTTFKPILVCNSCGEKERYPTAVLRAIEELQTLFPDKKITTSLIYDWCKIIKSKSTIRKTLKKKFKLVGYSKASYFVNHE
ncbi:nuclease-related domain-containing protein [Sutcliffiella halmapala]|uniref:nuclease-related domain-containing protein n=1 Tax=Sutcliffiella halmapala TaxID=79882 RepID=UPI001F45580E|nr:nuclease-related domain-containing protein [Sutcliffiella halmapala]